MKAIPTLDLTRLDRLRDQWQDARAATARAHEAAMDAHNAAANARRDRGALTNDVNQNVIIMDRNVYLAGLRKLEELELSHLREKEALFGKYEALAEKSKALGHLVRRCVEFTGGDANAR